MNQGSSRRARRRSWAAAAVASLVLVVGVAGAGTPLAARQAASRKSAWTGVYTDAQADRGEREYGRTCSHCHGLSLEGDGAREVPALVQDSFTRHWRGRTLQVLFDTLTRSMPADDSGTLTPSATADLIAYLLRANGAPAGEAPLPPDRAQLEVIVFDEKP